MKVLQKDDQEARRWQVDVSRFLVDNNEWDNAMEAVREELAGIFNPNASRNQVAFLMEKIIINPMVKCVISTWYAREGVPHTEELNKNEVHLTCALDTTFDTAVLHGKKFPNDMTPYEYCGGSKGSGSFWPDTATVYKVSFSAPPFVF